MSEEIKEILEALRDSIDDTGTDKVNFINWLDKIEDCITNLQEENEELKVENEKLTQLWLDSQEKRRKAIEYLEQPYRDNFDYSKAQLLNILQGDDNNENN